MKATQRSLWMWIPSLYFIGGIPYIIITTIATFFFKRIGWENTEIALYTGLLFLPWATYPYIENWLLKYPRFHKWALSAQFFTAISLCCIALAIKEHLTILYILLLFAAISFCNTIHDIAGKNIYNGISEENQSLYLGVRSKSYSISLIVGQGIILMTAGVLETYYRDISKAWTIVFLLTSILFLIHFVYHIFTLPHFPIDKGNKADKTPKIDKEKICPSKGLVFIILLLLLFNLPKGLLSKVSLFFLIDRTTQNGLGLSLPQIGFGQGTIGTIGFVIGTILGKNSLLSGGIKTWKWPMSLSLTLPNFFFLFLSANLPTHFGWICILLFIEQLGYGFGISFFFFYLTQYIQHHKSKRLLNILYFFMALGMIVPCIISGWLQSNMGYTSFFKLVTVCSLATLTLTFFMKDNSDETNRLPHSPQ